MRRGFSVLELLVAVAVVGILATVAGTTLARGLRRASVRDVQAEVRGAIRDARDLAIVAGARNSTPRLTLDGSCGAAAGTNLLWVQVTSSVVTFPVALNYDASTDVTTVSCESIDVAARTKGAATIDTGNVQFAFTAHGRLFTNIGTQVFVRVRDPSSAAGSGVRVLASGATCPAASPPPATDCDQAVGP